MPAITETDPRTRLVREKYFSLRPKPLERWIWKQGLPQAAERVFWLHWEEGMRARDWCSEIPLKRVAATCCIDASTVTRAYQILKNLGLIRRESAGRDPANPFQQATAITEVRIPRELLTELSHAPNRSPTTRAAGNPQEEGAFPTDSKAPAIAAPATATGLATPPDAPPESRPSRKQIQTIWANASPAEQSRYFIASRDGLTDLQFDPQTRLSAAQQAQWLRQLRQLAATRTARQSPGTPTSAASHANVRGTASRGPRRLSMLELARTRKRIAETVAPSHASEVLRQVIWAVEEGALRRFELPLAVNIAIKKIRDGAWTKPNRMPPNWTRGTAHRETCSAA